MSSKEFQNDANSPPESTPEIEAAQAAAALAFAAKSIEPPARLRDRIFAALDVGVESDSDIDAEAPPASKRNVPQTPPAIQIQTQTEGDWYSPAPGVQCKRLFVSDARGYRSTLMRMEPGSSFPAHVHRGVEEACVLEGRCEFDGAALAVGDYYRAAAGTRHGTLTSPEGCLMMILEHSRVAG